MASELDGTGAPHDVLDKRGSKPPTLGFVPSIHYPPRNKHGYVDKVLFVEEDGLLGFDFPLP